MNEALNQVTKIIIDGVVAGLGLMVGKWLNAWANKHKSEAESNQMNDLRDVAHLAADYVEQWAKTLVKESVGKPTSAQKLDLALDWVCDHYPHLTKHREQVRGFLEAAVKEMNDGKGQ